MVRRVWGEDRGSVGKDAWLGGVDGGLVVLETSIKGEEM